MLRKCCSYVLGTLIIGLVYSNSPLAQSPSEHLFIGEGWKPVDPSGLIESNLTQDVGLIIRSTSLNRSVEQSLKEHILHGVQEKFGRTLSPTEREKAKEAIEGYTRKKLQSIVIESDVELGRPAAIVVQTQLGGEKRDGDARKIGQRVFNSTEFRGANSEGKWRLLLEEVQKEVLNPTVELIEGRVAVEEVASVADVIRQATPEQLGMLFDIGTWPEPDWLGNVTAQVVAPGTPVSGNGAFSGACTGNWCGSPGPGEIAVEEDEEAGEEMFGRAVITYREDAYEQVVVLQPGKIGFTKMLDRCTATLISRNWAVSALHCFGVKGKDIRHDFQIAKGPISGWLELTADARSIFAVALRKKNEDKPLAFRVEKIYVPYVNAADIRYGEGEAPPKDVALIMIRGGEGTEFSSYPRFAEEGEGEVDSAVTFVGYGWTDIARQDWTKSKQTAFNWLTEVNSGKILWKTGNWRGNGGPCMGDSGGPIFLDFMRGFENEDLRMVGVVSALQGNGKIEQAWQCLGRVGEGEPVFSIAGDMCAIMNDPAAGCQ